MDKVIKVVGLAELEQSLLIGLEEARVTRGTIDGQMPNSTSQIRSLVRNCIAPKSPCLRKFSDDTEIVGSRSALAA